MFKIQPLVITVSSLMSVIAVNAFADDTERNIQILKPVVVTTVSESDSHGPTITANPKQAIQPAPASDGASFLRSIMGFNAVSSGGNANNDVTFRGMFGSRVKILDGGSENLGACPSRMDNPTTYISPESYDKITVIKGPQTVQYATPGSAATVLFERNPPKFVDRPYQGQASVMVGSFGRLDHNVEALLGNDKVYARINANRSLSNNYKDGNDFTVHSKWDRWNSDLALGWTPTENTWLELKGGLGDANVAYAGRAVDGTKFRRESLGLRAEQRHITEHISKIEAQIDYTFNDHVMDNFKLRTPSMHRMIMPVTRRTLNSRIALTSEWNKAKLIFGIDNQQNKHGGGMYMYGHHQQMIRPYHIDAKFASYGGFAELNYRFNPNNTLVTGVRADHVKVDDLDNNVSRTETLPSGFIRLENETPNYGLKKYIGIGYVERMPDYWELMGRKTGTQRRDTVLNLQAEKTAQLDLGIQMQHQKVNTWFSAYAGLINDFIILDYTNTTAHTSRNVDAKIAGAEAGIGYQFTDRIKGDISAMYAWGKNTTDHKPLPQIAPLEGRLNLSYSTEQYSFGLLWRVVAKQNRIALNQGNIVGYDLDKSKGFNLLSANASYKVNDAMSLSVGIDNLLNKTYYEHLNKLGDAGIGFSGTEQFNNIGRNYWAKIDFKF